MTDGAGGSANPAAPATALPPIDEGHTHKLPSSVLRLWRTIAIVFGLVPVVLGVIAAGLVAFVDALDGGPSPLLLLGMGCAAGALIAGVGVAVSGVRYRRWSYGLDEATIRASWGVFNHRSAVVAKNRVQTVTTEDGPVDRRFDLSTLTVHTAGAFAPNLVIPHLDRATVAWIRDELTSKPVQPGTDAPRREPGP